MSAATPVGWLAWLMPWLVMAGLALCVLRARRRRRRARGSDRVIDVSRGDGASAAPTRPDAEAANATGVGPPPAGAAAAVEPPRPAAGLSAASLTSSTSPMPGSTTPSPFAPKQVPETVRQTGRDAGRREVEALEALRGLSFGDREEAALQAQLARAPRDVGALFGLLQWHARRGERAQVETFAHALWDETDAEGELWRRAAALGRTVDPDNPLYSDDPFAALAEHAARQPARAPLALDAFDLSLSAADVRPATANSGAVVPGGAAQEGAAQEGAAREDASSGDPVATHEASGLAEAATGAHVPSAAFDFLSAPSARLPASFAGLDLELDSFSTPAAPSAGATDRARAAGKRRRGRGRGAGEADA